MKSVVGYFPWRIHTSGEEFLDGAVADPHFEYFTNLVEEPAAETRHLSWAMRQEGTVYRTADFSGAWNVDLHNRIRGSEMKNSFYVGLFAHRI